MLGTQNRLAWPNVSADLWRDMRALNGHEAGEARSSWHPAALVAESDADFTLRLEIPGVDAETLQVDLDGHHLTVAGERPAPSLGEGYRVLASEMAWGRFQRRFRLGAHADREAITASYGDGFLEITVPKRQEARPRRIPVATNA